MPDHYPPVFSMKLGFQKENENENDDLVQLSILKNLSIFIS
jgi:hypothetical protein